MKTLTETVQSTIQKFDSLLSRCLYRKDNGSWSFTNREIESLWILTDSLIEAGYEIQAKVIRKVIQDICTLRQILKAIDPNNTIPLYRTMEVLKVAGCKFNTLFNACTARRIYGLVY